MSLFALPTVDKRFYGHPIFNIGHIRALEMLAEDDDYIIYRLGYVLRLISLTVFIFVYTLCVLLSPEEIEVILPYKSQGQTLLYAFQEFFDYFSILFIVVTLYYIAFFYYHVDINKHNPLRHRVKGEKRLENISFPEKRLILFGVIGLFASSLAILIWPSILSYWFLRSVKNADLYNSYLFVFIIGLVQTGFVSICGQIVLVGSYVTYYIFRKSTAP